MGGAGQPGYVQMIGRAGRPGYDQSGKGIIITSHGELQFYLSLLNEQLPIESQFVAKLVDNLNAEIVTGAVSNLRQGATWLSYTYLYIRMLRHPRLYGVTSISVAEEDPHLLQRPGLANATAAELDRLGLAKYDRRTGSLRPTSLGRVASHFYLSASSMRTFSQHMHPLRATLISSRCSRSRRSLRTS